MAFLATTIDVDAGGLYDTGAQGPAPVPRPADGGKVVQGRKAVSKKLRAAAIHQVATGRPDLFATTNQWGGGNSYNGAGLTRLNRDWVTGHMSGDAAIYSAWDMLIRRSRDLVRNEPWAEAAVQKIVNNVVGDQGIGCEAEVEFDDGTLDDETNHEIDQACLRWFEEEADVAGLMHGTEIQQLAMREVPEAGETFLVACQRPDRNRSIPLCFQVIESEQLYPGYDWPGNWTAPGGAPVLNDRDKVKRGITFDKFGAPTNYHFWSDQPYDVVPSLNMRPVIVDAARVIHYFEKRRPSLTRGVTWFANILQAMRDLGEYLGDEMSAARVASLFAVAIKRAAGAGTGLGLEDDCESNDFDTANNPLMNLGSGIIGDLGPGDEIESIDPNRPNKNAEPFLKLILTSMANGIGMSYLGLTNDVAGANFSSARFARQGDRIFWRVLQGRFGRRVVLAMRQRVVAQLIAFGRIKSVTPTMFAANPRRWLATKLLPPGWEDIQPLDDIKASIERIRAGLSTLQEESAGRGKSWRKLLIQAKRERDLAEGLGLTLSVHQLPPLAKIDPATAPPADHAEVKRDERTSSEGDD